MTKLDAFIPEGEPIHPYDLYELLDNTYGLRTRLRLCDTIRDIARSPQAEDEADYMRNIGKHGTIIEIKGKKYFETTSTPCRTKRFA